MGFLLFHHISHGIHGQYPSPFPPHLSSSNDLWRTFCACLSAVLVINLVLTPLWLNIMYGNAFVISGMRLIKNAVKLPLDTALLYFLLKAVETLRKKAL